jgi:hypothetical protein
VAADYIRAHGLNTREGQQAMQTMDKVNFPSGVLDPPIEGAVFLKTAWMMVKPTSQNKQRYFILPGVVEVKAEDSASGQPQCIKASLAMVGMHIVQKTTVGMGDHWIWSTFEHVDNAPLSPHPRDPATTFVLNASTGDCSLPEKVGQPYNFFAPGQSENMVPDSWKWANRPPYAVDDTAVPVAPDNISRCWDILIATKFTNMVWQRELKETIWKNYMLISAQWRGNLGGEGFGMGELPLFLSNTSMESFIQKEGSCLSCHNDARDTTGQFSDFTFLLQLAR